MLSDKLIDFILQMKLMCDNDNFKKNELLNRMDCSDYEIKFIDVIIHGNITLFYVNDKTVVNRIYEHIELMCKLSLLSIVYFF